MGGVGDGGAGGREGVRREGREGPGTSFPADEVGEIDDVSGVDEDEGEGVLSIASSGGDEGYSDDFDSESDGEDIGEEEDQDVEKVRRREEALRGLIA